MSVAMTAELASGVTRIVPDQVTGEKHTDWTAQRKVAVSLRWPGHAATHYPEVRSCVS